MTLTSNFCLICVLCCLGYKWLSSSPFCLSIHTCSASPLLAQPCYHQLFPCSLLSPTHSPHLCFSATLNLHLIPPLLYFTLLYTLKSSLEGCHLAQLVERASHVQRLCPRCTSSPVFSKWSVCLFPQLIMTSTSSIDLPAIHLLHLRLSTLLDLSIANVIKTVRRFLGKCIDLNQFIICFVWLSIWTD